MRVFKPGELVKVVSLPWATYGEDVIKVGDTVTIHAMKPERSWGGGRYAVMSEMLASAPHHNIGTGHLQPTGLRVSQSRNKREGKLIGVYKGQLVRNFGNRLFTNDANPSAYRAMHGLRRRRYERGDFKS